MDLTETILRHLKSNSGTNHLGKKPNDVSSACYWYSHPFPVLASKVKTVILTLDFPS